MNPFIRKVFTVSPLFSDYRFSTFMTQEKDVEEKENDHSKIK